MAVEVEGGGGKLVDGGSDLRFLYGGFGGCCDISRFFFYFFTSNCACLLILYINYRRGQDTTRGTNFKLNKNNNLKSVGVRVRSPFALVGT